MGSRQPSLLATGDVQMEHGKIRVSRQTGKTVRGDYCSRIEPDKDPKREKNPAATTSSPWKVLASGDRGGREAGPCQE